MEGAVIVNGELIPAGQAAISLDNRAFHYADGLFESIRVVNGKACFLDAHWTRLEACLAVHHADEIGRAHV